MRVLVLWLCAALVATPAAAKPLQVIGLSHSDMSILDRGTILKSGEYVEASIFQVFESDLHNAAYVSQKLTVDCAGKRLRFDAVEAFADDGILVNAAKYADANWEPAKAGTAGMNWVETICGPPEGIQMPLDFNAQTFVPTARKLMKDAD